MHLSLLTLQIGHGIGVLAGALVHASLESLNLRDTGLGRTDARQLAAAIADTSTGACSLTRLNLGHNADIGDDGVEALAAAMWNAPALTALDLPSVGLGDRGAQALGKALRSPHGAPALLLTLNLSGNSITSTQCTDLQAIAQVWLWLRLCLLHSELHLNTHCARPSTATAIRPSFHTSTSC